MSGYRRLKGLYTVKEILKKLICFIWRRKTLTRLSKAAFAYLEGYTWKEREQTQSIGLHYKELESHKEVEFY